jgi:hypothetical protein
MIHKGGIPALTGFERKDIIADDALEPCDPVIAGNEYFSS